MKTTILALLSLSSLSSFAGNEPYVMDATSISILNDITGAIRATDDAKIFFKNVTFDKVSATHSADQRDSEIFAEGLLIVGGDMACGHLKLKITRSFIRTPMEMGPHVKYTSTLDESDISPQPFCKISKSL